ncbi:hypothetical protein JXD20_04650 [Candidatus Peregrinibacteria bacterium]|nr:hypothetical protein [Candidatus Peregrinibacteria bacterium]
MKQRNIRLFYLHELFFQFSDSMLLIVTPVFLYKLTSSISAVFAFIFLWNVIHSIAFIPVFNLAMKLKKPKLFMMFGVLFYISSQLFMGSTTPENLYLLIPAIFCFALYVSFYWMVKHWFLSVNVDLERMGKQVSIMGIIRMLISFIAPITAGFLSHFVSFNTTYLLGAAASLCGLIPMLLFHAPPHTEHINFKKVLHTMKLPEVKAIRFAFFSEGAAFTSLSQAWLLIFTIFIGSILNLGLLIGVTTLITSLGIWLSGHWFDKRKRTTLLTKLTNLRTLCLMLYLSIYFNRHLAYVWIVEFINRLAFEMQKNVSDSYLYSYSQKINPAEIPLIREFYINLGRLSVSLILAISFYFLPNHFLWFIMFIGPFFVLGISTMKRSDHLLHQR